MSEGGDDLDLDEYTLGQVAHGDSRACGIGCVEECGIDLVHGREIGYVRQEYGCLDHVVYAGARSVEECRHIGQGLARSGP